LFKLPVFPEVTAGQTMSSRSAADPWPPPRLGPKKISWRDLKTHTFVNPLFACQNVLKLTYSNLEFQKFPGEDPLFKGRGGEGRRGRGKGRREGKNMEGRRGTGRDRGGKEGRNGGWWGEELDMGSVPLETSSGSAPVPDVFKKTEWDCWRKNYYKLDTLPVTVTQPTVPKHRRDYNFPQM